MDVIDFDPTAPLAGPPEPWEGTDTPSRREGPPYHMTDMIAAEPSIAERILAAGRASSSGAAALADAIRATIDGGRRVVTTGCGTSEHGALGVATNNVAEYNGLLAALAWAIEHGCRKVHIRSDSELLVRQMRGEYKVKHPGLQPLHVRARLLAMELDGVTFEHVRRELNKDADRLSNLGMDESEAMLKAGRQP